MTAHTCIKLLLLHMLLHTWANFLYSCINKACAKLCAIRDQKQLKIRNFLFI